MRKSILLLCVLLAAVVAQPRACRAEQFDVATVLNDSKLYFTAPIRWDARHWLYAGGALLAVGAVHSFDDNVRTHFAIGDRAVLDGKDQHSTRDALPAAALVAGTFAYALWVDDEAGRVESYSMLEAAGLSAVTTTVLKFAAGRERPNESTDMNSWRNSGSSFPSLHSSAAFAIGTVFAESGGDEYRWLRRIVGYGLAGATAYTRVHDNVHWLSDTVAGAAIGIATAHFVLNRREERRNAGAVSVAPMQGGGVMLSYSLPLQ
jgi:membrane-associated phospholipid phosphatase